jgi:hypothetical protein
MLPDGTVKAATAVGTPDYISPETLRVCLYFKEKCINENV